MKQSFQAKRILMLKGHSAGIGDILRSSAAWRVLKDNWPEAELHLLFFSREPGYPSEELIRDHHLLDSFAVVDKRTPSWREWRRFWSQVKREMARVKPDLIIDFEADGLRTSIVSAWYGRRYGARTIGVNTVPGRNLFYSRAASAPEKFALQRGLAAPLEYTERDFVALSTLGLERNGCPIEIRETTAGTEARAALMRNHGLSENVPLLGLNIGCGTADAVKKRPDLEMVSQLVAGLQREHRMKLILMGAPFEKETNRKFMEIHARRCPDPVIDLAGTTSISGLTGLINACRLFISSDSGPYHIGVAMRVPTLAIFKRNNRQHFHHHPWIKCCIALGSEHLPLLRQAAEELLEWRDEPAQDRSVRSAAIPTPAAAPSSLKGQSPDADLLPA